MPKSAKKTVRRQPQKTGVCVGDKIIAKPCYTPKEVAEILGVGRTTLTDMMDRGDLAFEVISGGQRPATVGRKDGKEMRSPSTRRITFDALIQHSPWIKQRLLKLVKKGGE